MALRKRCGRAVFAGPTPHGEVDGREIDGCAYPRMKGKQMCVWHWLAKQPPDVQAFAAGQRRNERLGTPDIARVPKEEWPPGERWCAGCQHYVPFFYTTASRCKACASAANHAQRTEKLYGITPEEYQGLLRLQGGRCAVCGRRPRTKRLAVDHDHATGAVRGLLCANNEQGCNRAVVANLEQAVDSGLDAAKRLVAYFEHPPYERLATGTPWESLNVRAATLPPEQPAPF